MATNSSTAGKVVAGMFAVATVLALGVVFLDYTKAPTGPNQGAAIVGSAVTNLYAIAAGQQAASSFSNLSGFQA